MGAAQAVALQPGVSRSGVTITMGRCLRFDREAAARISFLMSLPIIAGAGLFEGVQRGRRRHPERLRRALPLGHGGGRGQRLLRDLRR